VGIHTRAGLCPNSSRSRHRTRPPRRLLLRKQEIDWSYQRGASVLYPDAWSLSRHIPEPSAEICSPPTTAVLPATTRPCDSRLPRSGVDGRARHIQAHARRRFSPATTKKMSSPWPSRALRSTISSTQGFFETDDQLLRNAARIRHIPGVIVQGRYRRRLPMESAVGCSTRAWPSRPHHHPRQRPQRLRPPEQPLPSSRATDKFA